MATILDLRRRIRSVKNTQQITRAMKMVAAARLRRSQERVLNARPYAHEMKRFLSSLAARTEERTHPLLVERRVRRVLLILVTADRGLSGAFNANLIRAAERFLADHQDLEIDMVAAGRKGRDFFRKRRVKMSAEYADLFQRRVEFSRAQEIAARVVELYSQQEVDAVDLIYSEFKSLLSASLAVVRILPFKPDKPAEGQNLVDYIYEQPPDEIFADLLPRYIESQIYQALLESQASEFAAKMTAMDTATRNASELLGTLTLTMNRVRQAMITKEIIEIVSGASAL
jgi:F-type H+-transporting ATPase subunit gamma